MRLIMSINHTSAIKYNSKIYSWHDGYYKKWWIQERVDNKRSLPISIDFDVELDEDSLIAVVYVRKYSDNNIQKISTKLLRYVGGQTHMICHKHKLPLISIPDRKLKCSCRRHEYFWCSDLNCVVCICNICASLLDIKVTNEMTQENRIFYTSRFYW